jgi:hypothetical protein
MIDISFAQYLGTLTALPIQQGKIDETQPTARVWFQQQSSNTSVLNNGTPYLDDTIFDVEVASLDIDQAQREANTIRTALNGYRGLMIFQPVQGVFVSDAADDYIPRNLNADEGFQVCAFQVRIIS